MKYNFKILLSQYVAPIAKHQELLFIFDLVCLQTNQWVFRDPGFALPNSEIPGLSDSGVHIMSPREKTKRDIRDCNCERDAGFRGHYTRRPGFDSRSFSEEPISG